MGEILDGKRVARMIRENIKQKVEELGQKGITPGLVVICVGDDPASQAYVRSQEKMAKAAGFRSAVEALPDGVTQEEVIQRIQQYNQHPQYHAILIQLPLPAYMDADKVMDAIAPEKNVDGLHAMNLGHLVQRKETIVPCTPKGIMRLLKEYSISLLGKKVVVIGQSTIVGRPVALLAMNQGATVTVCNSKTPNLKEYTQNADIVIAAIGKAEMLTKEYFSEGVIVIDVGMNYRDADGTLCGDVMYEEVAAVASYITPVPGGVGPMTIAMLLEQTLDMTIDQMKQKEGTYGKAVFISECTDKIFKTEI